MSAIYLDNAATTRPLPAVVDAMAHCQLQQYGNPSSGHLLGAQPRRALADAREFLRGTVGAARIVLTSGGSEADLLGVVGAAAARSPGRVLAAASDHPAVLRLAGLLGRFRQHFTALPVTADGDLDPETLFDALGPDVRVVSFLHGHNELGTLCRLQDLVDLVHRVSPDAHVHVDLVQTYGKIPFDLDTVNVDSVAVSAHKLHGPRGVGFLALSSKAKIAPLQEAGGQEDGMRGGTENVAGAVGMARAAETVLSHQAETARHTAALATLLEESIRDAFPEAQTLGHPERRLPHILSLRLPGVVGQTLMERASARDLAFSTGSACHAPRGEDAAQPDNHVLAAIGFSKRQAREVLRFSFCGDNTTEEVRRAAAIVIEEAESLVAMAPRRRSQSPRSQS